MIISSVILISFAFLGITMSFFVKGYWEEEKFKVLSENAGTVSQAVSDLVSSGRAQEDPTNAAFIICNDLKVVSGILGGDFFICDTNGTVVYCQEMRLNDMKLYTGSCAVHQKYRIPRSFISSLDEGDYSGITTLEGVLSEKSLVYATAVKYEGKTIGVVVATQSVEDTLNPFVIAILKVFGISAFLSLAIAIISIYFMTYEMTKPLRKMSEATKRYSNGDFTPRVYLREDNELSDLSNALNAMAKNLTSLESSRRSFVANVSHELKTPMTTIGGFIDGMLDGTIDDEHRNYYLSIVSDEVRRLSRLVTGMLNMSKIEAGELTIKTSEFDISEMIFKTMLGFEQFISKKNIEITGLDKITSTIISADEDMIHQVIYNLVDNAVKFTPESGNINFNVYTDDSNVYVSIRNTGMGIASEELTKVFERFYKVDKSRRYDVKGAGLGLYLVKNIVEMHGGQIKATSIEGHYTEFSFNLPIKNS